MLLAKVFAYGEDFFNSSFYQKITYSKPFFIKTP